MQLNEIIEENSITTISKRTRISVENIEKLVKHDFSDMKRVKALGFISILEREFGIELDTLKKECQAYFSSSPEEEFDARLVVTVPESGDHEGGRWVSRLLILLVLFGIGYGAWYFLADRESENDNNITVNHTGLIGSIVNQAKTWLGDSSAQNGTQTPDTTTGVWAKEDTEANKTDAEKNGTAKERVVETKTDAEKNDSAAEEQIIKEAKQEQKEMLAQASESNDSHLFTADTADEQVLPDADADTLTADNAPAVEQIDETLATGVPSMQNEKKEATTASIETLLPPKIQEDPKAEKSTKEAEKKKAAKKPLKKAKSSQVVTLHPDKKVWVGYTNLSTMKRAAKVIEEDLDFDTSDTSWILVAGHNAINFVVKGKKITPKKRDKNYFLIKKGKVKEISKEEFQKRNKSTVW